jgi:adenosylhomocysteine nucleosidase
MSLRVMTATLCLQIALIVAPLPANAAEALDTVPRTAIISAFLPEWTALQPMLSDRKDYTLHGHDFVTGTIAGKPVLALQSGISMVNASLSAQMALDRFNVSRIVFSGIAGNIDPGRHIGDVVVPDQWSEYLESVFARETHGAFTPPSFANEQVMNFGMIFPQPVEIPSVDKPPEKRTWFQVDAGLLAIARTIAITPLRKCTPDNRCLPHQPQIVVGGRGVSGQTFLDNAQFREYIRKAFGAELVDMESAAVAQVAYVNKTPFIAFRSLSDLAGGDQGNNAMETYMRLAAENSAATVQAFIRALP